MSPSQKDPSHLFQLRDLQNGIFKETSSHLERSKKSWSIENWLKKQRNSDLDDFLVVGIDFGTTYSGAAWGTFEDFEKEQIDFVTTWPDHGPEEGKAPTELYYEDGNVMWGYSIPPDADPIRWFKLLLLREEDLDPELRESEYILRGRKMLRESGKSATDLVGDYLGLLWKHVLETIYEAYDKSVIEAMTFHVVITVPAIWKDYARQEMKEATRKAGILTARPAGPTTLAFADEPEVAALATLREGGRKFDMGDVFLICDAGGGTVDLISYQVGDVNPIALQEIVEGTGGLCGGIFIDEAFETMCKNRLGRKWNKLSQTSIRTIVKSEWEYGIKPHFKTDIANKEYIVFIPDEAFEGSGLNDESRKPYIKNGRIHFASTDIQTSFHESFSAIADLVDEQICMIKEKKLSVAGIILVGGLGSSPYLKEYLKSRYARDNIHIWQSAGFKPHTAICRGAVSKGFLEAPTFHGDSSERVRNMPSSVCVTSTIARASLGVVFSEVFEEGKHLETDRFWSRVRGMYLAKNQVSWYLHKGENVSRLQPTQGSWCRLFPNEDDYEKEMTESIYQCEDDDPPTRLEHNVKKLCDYKFTIDTAYHSLENYTGRAEVTSKKLEYEIEMIPSGASTQFRVFHEGKILGSQNVNIDFQ